MSALSQDNLEHLRAEIDRLQREVVRLRDQLAERTEMSHRGWAIVDAVRKAVAARPANGDE
jgi:Tfp pilus assembly protein PilO